MEIPREQYLQRLLSARQDGFVKVITGLRRSGKSYLLFRLFRNRLLSEGVAPDHILEFPLDALGNEALRNPFRLAQAIREQIVDDRHYYILIDEIQLCQKVLPPGVNWSALAPEDRAEAYVSFYDVLNEFLSHGNLDLYVTGSNSKLLSSDIATGFRGRSEIIQVHPLSFAEFSAFRGESGSGAFREYMTYGGMPQVVLAQNETRKREILGDLFESVYLRDILERHRVQDVLVLECVMDLLCSSVGSLTNPAKLVRTLESRMKVQSNPTTLKLYLDYLEDAFLFRRAQRYDIRGKRYLEFPAKYYMEDVGVRNARLSFRQQEQTHLMENIIFNELVARGCAVDVGVVKHETRENGKHESRQYEIDFVVNSPAGKIYIQSAWGIDDEDKRASEMRPFQFCDDFFARLVVTGSEETPWTDEQGVTYVGVVPFLLNQGILDKLMK